MNYTVVYKDNWESGAHHYSMTKIKRVSLPGQKALLEELKDMNIFPDYIFVGWPPMVGEEELIIPLDKTN